MALGLGPDGHRENSRPFSASQTAQIPGLIESDWWKLSQELSGQVSQAALMCSEAFCAGVSLSRTRV